jgi:TetR/AcrR family transcriptional repressor of nem operon
MGRHSFKEKIVASGMQTVHHRGFAAVGLREITAAAGVAQGSFTNHFTSKDAFGVEILDRYFEELQTVIARTLENEDLTPLDRLQAYFEEITKALAVGGWRFGCLAGNMGLEAAEHSELIRGRLVDIFAEWSTPFGAAIRQGQIAGQINAEIDPDETGAALLESWHGAMLRMKIERAPAALDRFKRRTLPALLAGP